MVYEVVGHSFLVPGFCGNDGVACFTLGEELMHKGFGIV